MSNLVKQYYVIHHQDNKRVINSNSLAEARLRELAVGAKVPERERMSFPGDRQVSEDGFSSGILAEQVEVQPEPDPQEIARQMLADAKAQADQIVGEAGEQAEHMIEEARIQAQTICEEQKELGYAEGARAREEELAEIERSLSEEKERLEAELQQRRIELESEFQMRMEELEADIVDALIPVFDKVFHVQFGDQREILLALIGNTLMNVEVGNKVRIRTCEADKELLMGHLDEIREQAGADVSIELLQDAQMTDGQCQIETSYGVFDCGIDMHFQNLIKDIRSLV